MLTMLTVGLVLAVVAGVVAMVRTGSLPLECGKMLVSCAIVLVLISAVVGIVRGKARV